METEVEDVESTGVDTRRPVTSPEDLLNLFSELSQEAQGTQGDNSDNDLRTQMSRYATRGGDFNTQMAVFLTKKLLESNKAAFLRSGLTNSNWRTALVFTDPTTRRVLRETGEYNEYSFSPRSTLAKNLVNRFFSDLQFKIPRVNLLNQEIVASRFRSSGERLRSAFQPFYKLEGARVNLNLPLSPAIKRYLRYLNHKVRQAPGLEITLTYATQIESPDADIQCYINNMGGHLRDISEVPQNLRDHSFEMPGSNISVSIQFSGYHPALFSYLSDIQKAARTMARGRLCYYMNI